MHVAFLQRPFPVQSLGQPIHKITHINEARMPGYDEISKLGLSQTKLVFIEKLSTNRHIWNLQWVNIEDVMRYAQNDSHAKHRFKVARHTFMKERDLRF